MSARVIHRFILTMENERDLDQYLATLLDFDNSKHRQFVTDLKKRRFSSAAASSGNKKTNLNEKSLPKKNENKKKGKSRDKEKENIAVVEPPKVDKVEKKKPKFVNLYTQDGKDRQVILHKGKGEEILVKVLFEWIF